MIRSTILKRNTETQYGSTVIEKLSMGSRNIWRESGGMRMVRKIVLFFLSGRYKFTYFRSLSFLYVFTTSS